MNFLMFGGNTVHLIAFFYLIYDIVKNKSCAGISGRTQLLLLMVFCCRYTDLFTSFISIYNTSMKIIFIGLTSVALYLIYFKYRESYDSENDAFWDILLIVPTAILSIYANYYTLSGVYPEFIVMIQEVLWTFSIYLEALAIIPQYYMSRKCAVPQRILTYVAFLGVYRSLYIANWVYRYKTEGHIDLISSISGTVQCMILVVMLSDLQRNKEKRPKWQEITKVFTIQGAKVDGSAKFDGHLNDKECLNNKEKQIMV